MTRKDYEAIAAILAQSRQETRQAESYNPKGMLARTVQLESLIDRFADIFAADNPRFDRQRFLAACKPLED